MIKHICYYIKIHLNDKRGFIVISEYTEFLLFQKKYKVAGNAGIVIVLTPCSFLFAGLRTIFLQDKLSMSLTLVYSRTLKEALCQQKIMKAKLIIIAPESSNPTKIAMARLAIIKAEHMMREQVIPKARCLLLDSNLSINVSDKEYQLTKNSLEYSLALIAEYYIQLPRQLPKMNKIWLPLSGSQQKILALLLSGKDITTIADMLNITHQCVHKKRNAIIKKIGLRNKVLLINLHEKIFTSLNCN